MFFSHTQAQAFSIPGGTTGTLLDISPAVSVAEVTMDGVYPEKGYSINEKCTETIYLLEGSLDVICDGVKYELRTRGDVCSIPPGTGYRVEGKGVSLDIITPGWEKSQNRIVTD